MYFRGLSPKAVVPLIVSNLLGAVCLCRSCIVCCLRLSPYLVWCRFRLPTGALDLMAQLCSTASLCPRPTTFRATSSTTTTIEASRRCNVDATVVLLLCFFLSSILIGMRCHSTNHPLYGGNARAHVVGGVPEKHTCQPASQLTSSQPVEKTTKSNSVRVLVGQPCKMRHV